MVEAAAPVIAAAWVFKAAPPRLFRTGNKYDE
jgi:hypothetical protein